ncbi:MAG TPA: enoyl-CoA hydratase-related protein [Actinomycetota bacterium]|nr:enoyl-CoA hydratase-related protein [Actinomycetota bacterium]
MTYQTILVDHDGAVATVTLNRPDRRNAFNRAMVAELQDAFTALGRDRSVRAVVLTGAGGAFCSGADLAPGDEAMPSGAAPFHARMQETGRLISSLADLPMPTIAAVPGVAAGGGCNMALACDIVLAADTARFSQIFVKRGLTVDMGGLWSLPRRVGLHRAKELAFTGDFIDAAEADRIGLINRVVPAADLAEAAADLARRIAANAPLAVRMAKDGLNRSSQMSMRDALEAEARAQAICYASADVREGIVAFLEKREPVFEGE